MKSIFYLVSVLVLTSACQVSETVLSSTKNLSTIEVTDSIGILIPTIVTYRPDGYTEISGKVSRPYRYRNDEQVRKVSKVRGNNRYKLAAMLVGAAGITTGLTLIGQDGQANSALPYYILAGSTVAFAAGLGGMYVDTSVYQRLSARFYTSADTTVARSTEFEIQLNEREKVKAVFDTAGIYRVNVFNIFKEARKYATSSADTLTLYYGGRRQKIPVPYYSKKVVISSAELPLYLHPSANEQPVVYIEPEIFLDEQDVVNEQFSEVVIAGTSYFTDRSSLQTVYTNAQQYCRNLPDVNHLVSGFLKRSAQRFLIRLDSESYEQYQSRLMRFDAQKNTWLRQSLDLYALWIRDRMTHSSIQLIEYDPDNQLYLIELDGFGRFPVRVSRSVIKEFKESASHLSFYDIRLSYRRDVLEIDEISLYNTAMQAYFTYEMRMPRIFRQSKLWEKTQFPNIKLRSEVVNDFFAKSALDFKNLEDEYQLPVVQLPYSDAAAVLIEVAQYKYLPSANFTLSSLPNLKQLVTESFGIRPERMITEQNTTKADLLRIFGRPGVGAGQLKKSENPDSSLLILFVSGTFHYNADSMSMHIVPQDGHPSFLRITSIDFRDVLDAVRNAGYKKIIALLDGRFVGNADTDTISLRFLDDHVALIFSSQPGQQSYAHPRTLTSIFLHRFLKELSSIGQESTIGQIFDRMCCGPRSVSIVAREFHQADQTPFILGNKHIKLFKSINELNR